MGWNRLRSDKEIKDVETCPARNDTRIRPTSLDFECGDLVIPGAEDGECGRLILFHIVAFEEGIMLAENRAFGNGERCLQALLTADFSSVSLKLHERFDPF